MALPARTVPDPVEPSDEDLMLAYAGGDASAFDALYARHKGGIHRYLLRHCANAGTADELFQDVWMNVIRARATYVPSARLATWLYRIARHRLIDHWRAAGSLALVLQPTDDETLAEVPAPSRHEPERRVEARELGVRLQAAVNALPPLQRDVFLLHEEGGLSLAEIAALTEAGVATVKSRLRYASRRLRELLQDCR